MRIFPRFHLVVLSLGLPWCPLSAARIDARPPCRLQMLEESLRDVELRAQQQLAEEQRRNKELIVRVEREKQLEIENCTIK